MAGKFYDSIRNLACMIDNYEPFVWVQLIKDRSQLLESEQILTRQESYSDKFDNLPRILLVTKVDICHNCVEGFTWGSRAVFNSLEYLKIDWSLFNAQQIDFETSYGWCLVTYRLQHGFRVIIDINLFLAKYRFPDHIRPDLDQLERDRSNFIKVAEDKRVKYGDGGRLFLFVPLYYTKRLDIPASVRSRLNTLLTHVGYLKNDRHDDAPVLDIIDPDFNPNYMFESSWRKILELRSNSIERSYRDIIDEFQGPPLRTQYAWIPTDIIVENGSKVKTLGPIHNLPLHGNRELYACIFKVFQSMIPGFQKLGLISEFQPRTKLQVVVKAQRYEIPPNSSYSGHWHVEGKTENIVAAGVYYSKIDEGFLYDKLKYRTLLIPLMYTTDNTIFEYDIDIQEESAVVFANILPHKFIKLNNLTSQTLVRQFLTFFIVDPSKPLISTSYIWKLSKILGNLGLPNVVVNNILSFTGTHFNESEAWELRRLARESMKKELSGWGHLDYGNSGELEYFDPYMVPKNFKNFEYVNIQEIGLKGYARDIKESLPRNNN